MIQKQDCENYLANRFHVSAQWRLAQQERFPADKRNGKAAARLLELADITIPDDIWQDLAPYYGQSDSRWLSAVSDANRDVSFRKWPSNSAEYLANLMTNLNRN